MIDLFGRQARRELALTRAALAHSERARETMEHRVGELQDTNRLLGMEVRELSSALAVCRAQERRIHERLNEEKEKG